MALMVPFGSSCAIEPRCTTISVLGAISSVAYWYQLPGGGNDLPALPSREYRRPR